jgi:hypothetical protein
LDIHSADTKTAAFASEPECGKTGERVNKTVNNFLRWLRWLNHTVISEKKQLDFGGSGACSFRCVDNA